MLIFVGNAGTELDGVENALLWQILALLSQGRDESSPTWLAGDMRWVSRRAWCWYCKMFHSGWENAGGIHNVQQTMHNTKSAQGHPRKFKGSTKQGLARASKYARQEEKNGMREFQNWGDGSAWRTALRNHLSLGDLVAPSSIERTWWLVLAIIRTPGFEILAFLFPHGGIQLTCEAGNLQNSANGR